MANRATKRATASGAVLRGTGDIVRCVLVATATNAAVVGGGAVSVEASIAIDLGEVYCRAETPEPQLYYSTAARAGRTGSDLWRAMGDAEFGRLDRQTLDGLAEKFARQVAERHGSDVLLSVRCERTVVETTLEALADEVYFRDGGFVEYAPDERALVEWTPDYEGALKRNAVGRWGRRVALVIGNGAYEGVPLATAVSDAGAVGALLEQLGFAVTYAEDQSREAMEATLVAFRGTLEAATESSPREGSGGAVVADLETEMSAGERLVLYAARPGAVVFDATGGSEHTPFAEALLRHLPERGANLETLVRRVTRSVLAETDGGQLPWSVGSLGFAHYLAPEGGGGVARETVTEALSLVFYSGHGFQIGGRHYLVPVDIDVSNSDLDAALAATQLVALDDVLNALPAADLQVVLLDVMFSDAEGGGR